MFNCPLNLLVMTFGIVSLSRGLSLSQKNEMCGNISSVTVYYRDYFFVYLGRNMKTGEIDKKGNFYHYITHAARTCCNLTVEFVFENATHIDTEEIAMKNLVDNNARPRSYKFYVPEFADYEKMHVYDYQLSFVKLTVSPGHAVVMYAPDLAAEEYETAMRIMKNFALMLLFVLILSWLFGILGWAADHWKNPEHFPSPFVVGMFEGFWWSVITMATVGYGDKTTKSYLGRTVAVIWVMISAVLLSLFTAHTTTILDRSLRKVDYSETVGLNLKFGVLLSKDFDEFHLSVGAEMINFWTFKSMFLAMEKGEVDRLLFPDYEFLLTLFEIPEFRHYKKKYVIAKVYDSPFQIGMVLALDPEVKDKGDHMFLRCLRTEITRQIKKKDRNRRHNITVNQLYATETVDPIFSDENVTQLIYYVLVTIVVLTSIGISWDVWQYLRRRKTKHIETQNTEAFPMEKVMPVLHYRNYGVTTLC